MRRPEWVWTICIYTVLPVAFSCLADLLASGKVPALAGAPYTSAPPWSVAILWYVHGLQRRGILR